MIRLAVGGILALLGCGLLALGVTEHSGARVTVGLMVALCGLFVALSGGGRQ